MPRKALSVVEPEEEMLDDEIEGEEDDAYLNDVPDLDDDLPADGEAEKPQEWQPLPPAKPLTPEQIIQKIEELESYCAKADGEYIAAKTAAKAAKGILEDAIYRLRQFIAATANDGNRPLLQMAESNSTKESVQEVKEISDEASRTLIENLVSPSVANKLYAAGIVSVGDMVDFLDRGNQLKDLVGIGPGLAEKIGLVMEEFWASEAKRQSEATDNE
jgi:hypothetical protein